MKELIEQIPKQRNKEKQPLNTYTLQLLNDRKKLYQEKGSKEIRQQITTISKEINRHISKHQKNERQRLFETYIEKTGAIKKAFKELRCKSEWTANVKNKKGKKLYKRPDIINEATNFYENLYTSNDSSELPIYSPCDSTLPGCILKAEIECAINSQKNDKAPGEDHVTNELLKSLSETLQGPLQLLFNNILQSGKTPKQWSKSTIILIHKTGDRSDLDKYRPISLMSNIYKIFSKILLNRVTKILDENQPREQAGFRKSFSTMDHIHVVSQIIEKTNEYNRTLYMCFIDFTKAFDSLNYREIWQSLRQQGVEERYIALLYNIYSNNSAKVKLEREGREFPIRKGVRQGDPISPKIFSAVLESIFRNLKWDKRGLKIDGEYLSHLRFADDIVVFSENPQDIQQMLNDLARNSKKVGLSLNPTKTKIMTNGSREDVIVEGRNIEFVDEYIYLGQRVSFKNRTENEIKRRIAIAWSKYWSFKEIMKNKQINIKTKKKLYETAIMPSLMYGCQSWSLRKEDEDRLAICQRKMERSMLNIKLQDRIKNIDIRRKTKICDILSRIKKLKWQWAGHICRMENSRWTKRVTEWIPREGKRSKGRQRKRWADIFLQTCGPNWMTKARDRSLWRSLGEAYAVEATTTQECF